MFYTVLYASDVVLYGTRSGENFPKTFLLNLKTVGFFNLYLLKQKWTTILTAKSRAALIGRAKTGQHVFRCPVFH